MSSKNNFLIFSGSANPGLAKSIVSHLGCELADCTLTTFSDGEIRFQSHENVRGADVFIIQSLAGDINFHIMELLLMADAMKRASARRITAVISYYAYARQDRKDRPRVPISARLLADLLETAGFSRVLTIDLHANQIQGFFNVPVDNLMALPTFVSYLRDEAELDLKNLVIVSPDAGGVERARLFARPLHAGLAIGDKRRSAPNVAEVMHIIGEVDGCDAIVVDDIVDTAGTMTQTIKAIKKNGARRVFAACTHGIFSGQALERLNEAPLEKIFVTDTISQQANMRTSGKIQVLSVAKLFADAIASIRDETSVSKLFLI
ncbi:MAG: ribose-phosphate pyrophosphokinase [Acidobacteriota bacterium]|jgi:ribose-phosphate pyrophosphokinase|nr:ribose-phosphate pyrophosphokinase [Acidobacteriota bacterium]